MGNHRHEFARALLAATILTSFAGSFAWAADATDGTVEEITVSATRREELLRRVPASVAAYSQTRMDEQGVRQVEDIVRLTPGVNFFRRTQFTGSNTNIAIRGIQSTVATPTTGIYIDDVPIQARAVGFSASNVYPKVFDLDRVEVLRGPQGTLFGAGAEGGALRFITRQPSTTTYSAYARAETAFTENGSPSYEAGGAVGGPIVSDILGFRASAWYREDGGFVDRVDPVTGAVNKANSNTQDTTSLRAAFTLTPSDRFKATASIYYQKINIDDTSSYWEALSNPGQGSFRSGQTQAQPVHDRYVLPSLSMSYDFGPVSLYSTTAFFDRKQTELRDYTNFDAEMINAGKPYVTIPGQIGFGYMGNKQQNVSQEVRLQSQGDGMLQFIVGGFYSHEKQIGTQANQDAFQEQLIRTRFNGSIGVQGYFGVPYLANNYLYDSFSKVTTEQTAGFGQLDLNVTDTIKLTAGARWSMIKVTNYQLAVGPWAGGTISTSGDFKEYPITPKAGASWQITPDSMVYASAAKGFRPGGAQTQVPQTRCGPELTQLGYTSSPSTYQSDNAWSYEAGSKNSFAGGRVSVDASAYLIKWKNIQNSLYMPLCAASFIANTGTATSKGFDIAIQTKPFDNLLLGLALGYTKATYDADVFGGSGLLLFGKGDYVYEGPKLSFTLSGEYAFPIFSDRDGFLRADYTYGDRAPDKNPKTYGYDAQRRYAEATNLLNARLGIHRGGLMASVFVTNLIDYQSKAGRYRLFGASPLFTDQVNTPRTMGLTVTYQY